MDVHPSAGKHGVSNEDLRHAVDHALYRGQINGGPPIRVLYLGPDRAANFLEIVVIERDDGTELAIHAMKMRPRYEALLPPGDEK